MTVNLSSKYLGLTLKNPVVASASPLTHQLDTLKRLEDAGVAAVVLPSLFEEQIEHDEMALHHLQVARGEGFAEALSYLPEMIDYNTGPDRYLEHITAARQALGVPVIASLNGVSKGGWVRYARLIEQAGASALELNVYLVAADPDLSGADIEGQYLDLVREVRANIRLPLTVKVGPFFSSFAHMAGQLAGAGADGLTLFNRFLQPDIDLDKLEVVPNLLLSTPAEIRLPLRWIAILKGRVKLSLAATGGAHSGADLARLLLVGADCVMVASAALKHGPEHLGVMRRELEAWLEEKEYESVEQMKGSLSQEHSPDPGAFERANYMKALTSWGK